MSFLVGLKNFDDVQQLMKTICAAKILWFGHFYASILWVFSLVLQIFMVCNRKVFHKDFMMAMSSNMCRKNSLLLIFFSASFFIFKLLMICNWKIFHKSWTKILWWQFRAICAKISLLQILFYTFWYFLHLYFISFLFSFQLLMMCNQKIFPKTWTKIFWFQFPAICAQKILRFW